MDARRLEIFRNVYEHRSFSKAGTALFLSQPTISSHIATLEKELGTSLFDRIGRSIYPTQAAEVLYRHALEIFEHIKRARADIDLLSNKVVGELTIGGSSIPAHYILPTLFAGFAARYPAVYLRMAVGDSSEILHRVEAGELILAIVGAKPKHPELLAQELVQDELVIIGGDRFASRLSELEDSGDLLDLPWVMREAGSGTRKAFEDGFSNAGLDFADVHAVAEVESTEAVLRCVSEGLGVGVVSRLAVSDRHFGDSARVAVVPFPLPVLRSFYLVRHAGRMLLPAAAGFTDYALERFAIHGK